MLASGNAVAQWVFDKTGGCTSEHTQGIGYSKNGVLQAAFAFDGYNKHSINMHNRFDGYAPKNLWRAAMDYVFITLGCKRVTGLIAASNEKSRKLAENTGFEYEATLKNAANDGGDLIVYVLWKDKCRMLNW
jgi:L-amino acid N-acyltransferase YncA